MEELAKEMERKEKGREKQRTEKEEKEREMKREKQRKSAEECHHRELNKKIKDSGCTVSGGRKTRKNKRPSSRKSSKWFSIF